MRNYTKFLWIWALFCTAFIACQKAVVAPDSDPSSEIPKTITPPAFSAEVNNSQSLTSFTPIKSIAGGYTNLEGTSTFYTIVLTFPSSTGPGSYTIGSAFAPDFTAILISGTTTYVVNPRFGLGSLRITSVSPGGNYSGTFNFDAEDTLTLNSVNVSQGSFSNF